MRDRRAGRGYTPRRLDTRAPCLGSRYAENQDDIFDLLEPRQPDAVRNAERLMAQYPAPDPGADNPSTTVHLLVAELNRYRRP